MKLDNAYSLNPALLSQAKTAPDVNMARIEETAREFEAMFLSEMLKPMFDTLKVNETFGGGKGEEIFSGFLRDEYSKILAGTGTIGIAEQVKEQLIEMQAGAQKTALAQNMQGNSKGITGAQNVL
jgi:peptidoglycan hydrolase FlgJ